jgi:prepilin-type N-terminal cleavage/methylation domain-containing protein/prepilin-type processing-associated H-X9-DG protein
LRILAESNIPLKQAFTLIELLIVLAVIAILVAIVLPVFAKVRDKGRQAACSSNLRQLSLAFLAYEEDYDQYFPGATYSNSAPGTPGGWMYQESLDPPVFRPDLGSLYPYVKNSLIYVCPSDGAGSVSGDSYALNGCSVAFPPVMDLLPGKAITLFDNPSEWLLLAEEASPIGTEESNPGVDSTDDAYLYYDNTISTRHANGSNVAFMDGHVKWYQPSTIDANSLRTGGVPFPGGRCPS